MRKQINLQLRRKGWLLTYPRIRCVEGCKFASYQQNKIFFWISKNLVVRYPLHSYGPEDLEFIPSGLFILMPEKHPMQQETAPMPVQKYPASMQWSVRNWSAELQPSLLSLVVRAFRDGSTCKHHSE